MPGLSHLRDVYDKKGKEFLDSLLNKTVIVNEKMDGAFFGAQKAEDGKFRFFKRNAEMNYVDRVLSRYYEPAVRHFEGLPKQIVDKIPTEYHFGMEWFTSPKAQSIAYDRLPKNGLILSYIHIMNSNNETVDTIQDKATLDYWADALGIERPPIIFEGKLSADQREKIQEFVYTPFNELIDKFKTTSFTKYIITVLNPSLQSSFLRDSLDKDIEGLVFRFYDPADPSEDSVFLAKLVDPVFQANAKQKAQDRVQKKSDDYIWIIVIDLMNFIERYSISELREIEITGDSYEHRYISLVNHIYLDFIGEFGDKYRELDIQIPDFLQREDFNVNYDLIKNQKVIKLIEANPNFKEIYRVFLNIFRKKKVRVSSTFFTKEMKANLNSQIDKLSNVIMGDSVYENYFPTFNEFVGEDKDPGYFETFAEVPEDSRKSKRVNLLVSDFQPIHQGHIKASQKLFDENGLPCVLVCVHTGETSKTKPFKKQTVIDGLSKVMSQHPSIIAGQVLIPDNEIENLLRAVKPDYEPVVIAASKSRIRDLALQLELARKRSRNLNLRKDLKLMELPAAGIKDSIMNSIKNQDYLGFKKAAPSAIHSEFFNMNRDLSEKLNESVEAKFANEVPVVSKETDEVSDLMDRLSGLKQTEPEKFSQLVSRIESLISEIGLSGEFSDIVQEIVSRNYSEADANRFVSLIKQSPDAEIKKLINFIKGGNGLSIDTLGESGMLTSSDFDEIDETILHEILRFHITNKSGSSQGKGIGEMCSILFKDGRKMPGVGDIGVGSLKIEVKGEKGRLISSGSKESVNFTNGRSIILHKIDELKRLTNSPEVSDFIKIALAETDGSPRVFNINEKFIVRTWKPLFKLCIDAGMSPADFAEWFVSIFSKGIWTNGCGHEADLKERVTKFFLGETSPSELINAIGYHSLLYYAKVDDFKMLFVISSKDEIHYMRIDTTNLNYETFTDHFLCQTGPQWQDPQNHNIFNIFIR